MGARQINDFKFVKSMQSMMADHVVPDKSVTRQAMDIGSAKEWLASADRRESA